MRIMILDSIMSLVPVVTTTKGVEGISLTNGSECIIADSPEEFADSIICLCQDIKLQQQLVQQATIKMDDLYRLEKMLEKRMNIYSLMQDKNTNQ